MARKSKSTGKPVGAPPKEIDKKRFESMCAQQCTLEDVACEFDVDENTVNAWCNRTYGKNFSVVFAKKRRHGYMSLRSASWDEAVNKRTPALLIFMLKNHLGMSDRVVTENLNTEVVVEDQEDIRQHVASVFADYNKRRAVRS
jgi:hypothetical protein